MNILEDAEHEKRASEARTVRNTNFAALSALPPTRGQTFTGSISPSPSTLAAPKAVDQKEFAEALRLLERAQKPYIEEGFSFREEYWGGTLESSPKAITQQLFRGNSYWFMAATDDDQQGIELHVYDSDGNLAEAENWLRSETTGARVEPKRTGAFYVVISRAPGKPAPQQRQPSQTAHWVATYGYR